MFILVLNIWYDLDIDLIYLYALGYSEKQHVSEWIRVNAFSVGADE